MHQLFFHHSFKMLMWAYPHTHTHTYADIQTHPLSYTAIPKGVPRSTALRTCFMGVCDFHLQLLRFCEFRSLFFLMQQSAGKSPSNITRKNVGRLHVEQKYIWRKKIPAHPVCCASQYVHRRTHIRASIQRALAKIKSIRCTNYITPYVPSRFSFATHSHPV